MSVTYKTWSTTLEGDMVCYITLTHDDQVAGDIIREVKRDRTGYRYIENENHTERLYLHQIRLGTSEHIIGLFAAETMADVIAINEFMQRPVVEKREFSYAAAMPQEFPDQHK